MIHRTRWLSLPLIVPPHVHVHTRAEPGDAVAVLKESAREAAMLVLGRDAQPRNRHQYGRMAPGRRDPRASGTVIHHLNLAHGRAVAAFRSIQGIGRIGPCLQLAPCYPADESPEAEAAAMAADTRENTLYLDPLLRGRYPDLSHTDRRVAPWHQPGPAPERYGTRSRCWHRSQTLSFPSGRGYPPPSTSSSATS